MSRVTRTFASAAALALVALGLMIPAAQASVPVPTFLTKWGSYGSGNGQFYSPTGVATDTAGNVYVADTGNNRILKFDPSGAYLTQWGGPGFGNGQFNGPFGVAADAAGNVYVAEYGNDRIQKFDSSGTYLTQWGSSGSGNGQFNGPTGVAIDAAGNVYVSEYDNNRVQKFDSSGTYLTQWGTFGFGNGQFNGAGGIAIDTAGNVYVSDYYNNRIQKFDPSGTYLTQWGTFGFGNGELNGPFGIAIDAAGSVYVTELINKRIQKFDPSGTYLTQWGGPGSGNGQFNGPFGVAPDATGNVYVTDNGNDRIQKFDTTPADPETSITYGPSGSVSSTRANFGFSSDWPDHPPIFAATWGTFGTGNGQFQYPGSVATDTAGNVYVADTLNHRIQKFDASGTYLTQWGGFGTGNGQFHNPFGVATDASGNVYVTDSYNHRIQKFDSSGTYLTQWGSSGSGNGQLSFPGGVAIDAAGNIYVADTSNDRIQKFDSSGTYLTQWGSFGTGNGQFDDPNGVAIDAAGNVYVADTDNHRIQKFDASGAYLTKWGSWGSGAQFDGPLGIAVDASGDIYVANLMGQRIQKFIPSLRFRCSLDSGPFQYCQKVYTGLSDGQHSLWVKAINIFGEADEAPAIRNWTVDTIPPNAIIGSGPQDPSSANSATFAFGADEDNVRFACQLDAGGYSACYSGQSYFSLSDGAHTFHVVATDKAGNASEPATYSWIVDAQPQVDGIIKSTGSFLGDGIYNTNGAGQTILSKVKKGKAATFTIQIQNDSAIVDDLTVKAPGSVPGFKVTWMDGVTNITSQVTGAGYALPDLPSGATHDLTLKVKLSKSAGGTESWLASVTGAAHPGLKDAVLAKVKAR